MTKGGRRSEELGELSESGRERREARPRESAEPTRHCSLSIQLRVWPAPALGPRGAPRGCPCGGEMGSHGPPQAPIFSDCFSFLAFFYLFSWEFGVLAAMLSRLATACRRS